MTDTPEWGQITRKPDKATLLAIAEAALAASKDCAEKAKIYNVTTEAAERTIWWGAAEANRALYDALRAKAGGE